MINIQSWAEGDEWSLGYMNDVQWIFFVQKNARLTLNKRGPNYSSSTVSISWLLMPKLLASPGYQHPWYWLCRIGKFLSYSRTDLNYLRLAHVKKLYKLCISLYFLKNLTCKGKTYWPLGDVVVILNVCCWNPCGSWALLVNCSQVNATNTSDGMITLVQVMAWCCQATSHYLSQCWPRSMLPYEQQSHHKSMQIIGESPSLWM